MKPKPNFSVGVALGATMRAALGTATHNLPVGVVLGVGVGVRRGFGCLAHEPRSVPERRTQVHKASRRLERGAIGRKEREHGSAGEQDEVFGPKRRDRDRHRNLGRDPLQSRRRLADCRTLPWGRGRSVDWPHEMSSVRGQRANGLESQRDEL